MESRLRDYDDAALRRLLDEAQILIVNGSPVEVKAATELPPGHLDPWVLKLEQAQKAQAKPTTRLAALRALPGAFVSRDKRLLEGRAALAAFMDTPEYDRDITSGEVEVTRLEWSVAGEVRAVWKYERRSESQQPRAAFLHLHGGGFSAGTPNGRDPFLRLLADRSGAVVFDLDYSMLPERPFPQAILEAEAALVHLHEHAPSWNIDPTKLAIGGGSAGGNIAAGTVMRLRQVAFPPVALQVLYSPFLSFGGLQKGLSFTPVEVVAEHRDFAGPQSFGTLGLLIKLLYRAYRGEGRRDDPMMSPALTPTFANLPPTLIICGEMDPLHQPAEHFAGDLARAGTPVRTIRYRGCKHETVSRIGFVPQGEAAALETAAALRSLGQPGSPFSSSGQRAQT